MRNRLHYLQLFLAISSSLLIFGSAIADEPAVLAGHSYHGEAYNEGPRQAAYLMPGMGNISFPASTENDLAQRFINQGVAQLHGFWYYEAERSFRQAAVHDPACAISFWGMAMANSENITRARSFIEQAVKLKEKASRREQLFIEAYAEYWKEDEDPQKKREKKERAQKLTRDLETLVEDFPDDLEAKAFLAVQLWQNERSDLPITSYVAVNALIQDIFDANPLHPAHHYRIHLWDGHKPAQAVHSSAMCGPSLPGIAHMWHMPGHIYSKLHRYQDACWQQEASARVDHAHMMRDRVLPDQIHNFAHNNEWLIRNLNKTGRVADALSLAKNMQELPRHPKYNTLERGSTKYGRERLLLTLSNYRLWPELIEFASTVYLEPTDDPKLQNERLRYLGIAYALTGHAAEAQTARAELAKRLKQATFALEDLESNERPPVPPAKADASAESSQTAQKDDKKAKANQERREQQRERDLKELKDSKETLTKQIAAIRAAEQAGGQQWAAALDEWEKSDLKDELLKAEWMTAKGDLTAALELIDKEIESNPGEVLPLATKAWLQFQASGSQTAKEPFEQLRVVATAADLETPLLERLAPIAAELGIEQHWAIAEQPLEDIGARPDLDSLGSFRWHPYMAPDFSVERSDGVSRQLKQVRDKPTLVIFYLGFGCLHCVEQLHEFSPRVEQFREAGIEIMAISTEDSEAQAKALSTYSKPLAIPLHTDPNLTAFKAYRCYDDFENQPLHGTFLIAPDGRVLWQDISYEPFMDAEFCLSEGRRLLKLAGYEEQPSAATTPDETLADK